MAKKKAAKKAAKKTVKKAAPKKKVANAKPEIIENERKKMGDGQSKLQSLKRNQPVNLIQPLLMRLPQARLLLLL